MDQKIQLQDLAETLAASKGLTKKDAALFVRTMFEIISDALDREKYVKIKGLGTFKQVTVESRESINVNTGERFIIQGHSKISFTPDAGLRDTINKPFAHFETVVLNDNVGEAELDAVDKDLNDVHSEVDAEIPMESEEKDEDTVLTSVVSTSEKEKPTSEKEFSTQETKVSPRETEFLSGEESIDSTVEIELSVAETEQVTPIKEEVAPETEKENAVAQEVKRPTMDEEPENIAEVSCTRSKKSLVYRISMFMLLVILAGVSYFIGYYRYLCPDCIPTPVVVHDTVYVKKQPKKSAPQKDTIKTEPKPTETTEVKKQPKEELKKIVEKSKPTPPEVETIKDQNPYAAYPQVKGGAYWITGTMQTYTIGSGETIRIIAERFFGSRQMALYIVRYNAIADPDHVSSGTVLKIPKLTAKDK